MEQPLRVRLFGSPELILPNGARGTLATRKAWALLAYLARHSSSMSRGTLAALLWPDLPEGRGRRNLSRELTQLSALAPATIAADYHTVAWSGEGAWIDVCAAEALLRSAQPAAPSALAAVVALYRGPFLDGFFLDGCAEFESWLVREREFWQQQVARALERLIAHHLERGEFDAAQSCAQRWLELEPWQEEAHRALMTALARAGRRTEALAQLELCRRALARELDAAPGLATLALAEQIRAGALEPPGPAAISEPRASPISVAPPASQQHTPSPAPAVARFFGRAAERAALARLLDAERCRVIAVLGMGGIGKTTLAAQVTRERSAAFDAVAWRSLLHAPPLPDLLRTCLPQLGAPPAAIPDTLDDQLALLLDCLRRQRCLLVLDNAESLLLDGERVGQYRPGYEEYGQLLRIVADYEHQSCVLLTSRELPPPLPQLAADTPLVATLRLAGLDADAGGELLGARGVAASREAATLVARYSGNPLALALVADVIHELYAGDLQKFLRADSLLFDDIRAVLDQQWARLTVIEQDVLLWLAVCRETRDSHGLAGLLAPASSPHLVRDTLRSLQRRSLVEPGGARFGLQNVVLEYLSERLADAVCAEIVQGAWRRFGSHALMLAQSPEHLRQSQERLLLAPVASQLVARLGLAGLRSSLLEGLAAQRTATAPRPGYAAGNALNLLLHLGIDLQGADFSRLCVWQADLRRARLLDASFAYSDLRGTLFTETLRDSYALAWSPDGALIASGVGNGEIRLWRADDWRLVGSCAGPPTFIWHLAFSPNSDRLASCDDHGDVRVWDIASCQPLYTLRGHGQRVQALAWSPDGALLAIGGDDTTTRIWHVERTETLHTLCGHTGLVRWAAWSPNGALVATASYDGSAMLWNSASGERVATLLHPDLVQALDWHPGGGLLATSCGDAQVRLWDTASGAVVRTLATAGIFVHQLAWSPDGALVAGGGGSAVRIWNADTGELRARLQGHNQNVTYAVWSPDGARLASRSLISVRLWELASEQPLAILQGTSLEMHALAISSDERLAATSHVDGLIRIWELASGAVLHTLHGPTDATIGLSFDHAGATLATASLDGCLRIWDTARGALLRQLQPGRASITCLARNGDGNLLATGCHDGTVWLWEWRRGQTRCVLRGHVLPVTCVAFGPDGTTLASSSEDRTLHLWNIEREQVRCTLPSEGRSAYGLVFNPTGETLYATCNDEQLRVWDVPGAQLVRRLRGASAMIGLSGSPDGARLVSSGGGEVRVWDLADGETALTVRHVSGLGPARFVQAGRALVTGSYDGTLYVWDAQSGELLRALPAPGPYQGMHITGATGLSAVQRESLRSLGATDEG